MRSAWSLKNQMCETGAARLMCPMVAANLLPRHLDAAALADDALVPDALVLAAIALPVLRRTEDALAEQTVMLGLEGGSRSSGLRDLARRPIANLLRRREADPDRIEAVDRSYSRSPVSNSSASNLFLSVRELETTLVGRLDVGKARLQRRLLDAASSSSAASTQPRHPGRRPPRPPRPLRPSAAGGRAQRARRQVDAEAPLAALSSSSSSSAHRPRGPRRRAPARRARGTASP